MLGGRTSAQVPGTNEARGDLGDSGYKFGLHSGGDRRGGGNPGQDLALGPITVAPQTVSQVSVIVPTLRAGGKVMVEGGPGPLGLCPVRGVTEVDREVRSGWPTAACGDRRESSSGKG